MKQTRVLVVDDSAFMRQVISNILNEDNLIKVVGTARNGQDALQKIKILQPDLVTLDIEMPIMDGLTTLTKIMETNPLPVIMVSSHTSKGADATLKALEKGAVDFIAKPAGVNISEVKEEIIHKVKVASRININKSLKETKVPKTRINITSSSTTSFPNRDNYHQIVMIGTSTGGPKALQEVLPLLPENFPAPVLVVQHMPPGFTKSLADRLNSISAITIKEAEPKEVVRAGVVYIAPGDFHLTIEKRFDNVLAINLTKDSLVSGHRPSVNVMMDSVCNNFSGKIIGVIMTGMGNDGTEGMKLIKLRQGATIAEDESTCVVYGMPKAAIQARCVDVVVPLFEIANTIIKQVKVRREE